MVNRLRKDLINVMKSFGLKYTIETNPKMVGFFNMTTLDLGNQMRGYYTLIQVPAI